jgi:hypothetical protein
MSQPHCHQYYLLSLQLTRKNTRRSKFLDVQFSFPLVSSPHTLKIRSAYASDAGALSRSNASGDNSGNLEAFVSQKLMTLRTTGAPGFKCDCMYSINSSSTVLDELELSC